MTEPIEYTHGVWRVRRSGGGWEYTRSEWTAWHTVACGSSFDSRLGAALLDELHGPPPVPPRTVEVDGETWTLQENGDWTTPKRRLTASSSSNRWVIAAFQRVWELEHPDA